LEKVQKASSFNINLPSSEQFRTETNIKIVQLNIFLLHLPFKMICFITIFLFHLKYSVTKVQENQVEW